VWLEINKSTNLVNSDQSIQREQNYMNARSVIYAHMQYGDWDVLWLFDSSANFRFLPFVAQKSLFQQMHSSIVLLGKVLVDCKARCTDTSNKASG
jgi:hypothetical protein